LHLQPVSSAEEVVGGLEVFLYEEAQNFELFSNNQDQNLKIKNLKRLVSFSRPMYLHCTHTMYLLLLEHSTGLEQTKKKEKIWLEPNFRKDEIYLIWSSSYYAIWQWISIAKWLEFRTANAKVATVLGFDPRYPPKQDEEKKNTAGRIEWEYRKEKKSVL
jgi:hypothetical protein